MDLTIPYNRQDSLTAEIVAQHVFARYTGSVELTAIIQITLSVVHGNFRF
jgi:hypothetical protein